ncbi:hypothetical protein WJX72_005436 [[Myrmecia] bisecta]|uniref:DUF3800 domain-containing protein n=1 Tax=[Myrmecia] bisecta TaxID=41462 RepID=A0AAW1R7P2_9CHLO
MYPGQDGDSYVLPGNLPLLNVLAHNAARKLNAGQRFVLEFKDLIEDLGHRVDVSAARPKRREQVDLVGTQSEKEKRLLEALRLEGDHAASLRQHIFSNQASEDDKWAFWADKYLQAWGLDRVDAPWLKKHGTGLSPPRVQLAMRLLYPTLYVLDHNDRHTFLKITYVQEVLHDVLGLNHPFDFTPVSHSGTELLTRFMATSLYANYAKGAARLFDPQATTHKDYKAWDRKDLVETVNMVLGSIGLKLKSKATGKVRRYSYTIDAASATDMGRLVNLKLARLLSPPSAGPLSMHSWRQSAWTACPTSGP